MSSTEKEEFDCPHCSHGPFTGSSGLKRHFTVVHASHLDFEGSYSDALLEIIPEKESIRVKKTFHCEHCGDEFSREVKPEENRSFCSRSCQAKELSEGTDPRKPRKQAREAALERDNYVCQRCGCDVESGHRETSQSAEIHHLFPKMAGGTDDLKNLVTLCYRCHRRAHWDMKNLPEHHPKLLEELREVVCDDTE